MKLPKVLQNVIDSFEQLPGIGPKSAQRLAFYMLRMPKEDVMKFSNALADLKEKTIICSRCYNVGDDELCEVCSDSQRENHVVCVVESPLDLLALEKSRYSGLYHVLHGVLNPMAGIGPDEIFIDALFKRIEEEDITEVILATGTSLEGEATAMYIKKNIKDQYPEVKLTRIGRGLPVGVDIEYTDQVTLNDALNSRVEY